MAAEMNNHIYRVHTHDGRVLFSLQCATRPEAPSDSYPCNQSHMRASLVLVTAGEGMLSIEGNERAVREGDLILIRHRELHHLLAKPGCGLEAVDISISPVPIMPPNSEWADQRLSKLFFSTDPDFDHLLPHGNLHCAEMTAIIRRMQVECFLERPNEYALRALFLQLLSRLPQVVDIDRLTDHGAAAKHTIMIANAVAYISHNLTRDITLTKIAQNAGMEVSRFSEVFKSIQGISPWNYVLRERIKLAKGYLRENECYYSITQIAAMSGFENLSNFNKVFKAVVGMTPSEYRKGGA